MNTFGAFLRGFFVDPSQDGYRQPGESEPQAPRDPETWSASVNLEDLIEEYDEPSRVSRLTSSGPSLNPNSDGQPSQSYFSLPSSVNGCPEIEVSCEVGGSRDEETTSFYSALHDGFSLDEFELRSKYGREFFWNTTASSKNSNGEERDTMLQKPDFQVSWHDLNYKITPGLTILRVWSDLKARLTQGSSSALRLFNSHERSWSPNGMNPARYPEITILRDVNGSFESGQLTAVMGPSGAGKTSLLNILSRRREDGFTGRIHVDRTDHPIKINAIPQDDSLLECMTVRENLKFASRLKNTDSNRDHDKDVRDVSKLLGLEECLDVRTKSISGGQQKRLAIAQEILSKPDILILDEPTSGLDSLTCLKTLDVLNDLVRASRKKMIDPIAIVLTIHQPQKEAFNLFDKVYVMANGGIVIYDGPPSNCTEYIEKYSGLKMPSLDYNPASFLIEIASGEYGQEPIDALAAQTRLDFRARHRKSIENASNKISEKSNTLKHSISLDIIDTKNRQVASPVNSEHVIELHGGENSDNASNSTSVDHGISQRAHKSRLYLDHRLVKSSSISSGHFFLKTKILTERCWKSLLRDTKQVVIRILVHIFLPIGLAFMMGTEPGGVNMCPIYNTEYAMKKVIQSDEYISPTRQDDFLLGLENVAVLFVSIYSCISANIAAATLIFFIDLRSCIKEYYNGWYSMNSYVFARLISNLPFDIILPSLTMAITYIATGQNPGNGNVSNVYRVVITACGVILASSIGQLMGMIFATIYVGHMTTALFASQASTFPSMLLSGFVARTKNMSKLVKALSMTSFYKHGLDITFIARYGWNVCDCDPNKVDGRKPELTGVSDELRNFIRNWMVTTEETDATNTVDPSTSLSVTSSVNSTNDDDDVFQIIAKQIQLYNTYGLEVSSCRDMRPYLLYDMGLTESDLPSSFTALFILLAAMLLTLLLTVKLTLSYRTSL